jgi:hypothetical protein
MSRPSSDRLVTEGRDRVRRNLGELSRRDLYQRQENGAPKIDYQAMEAEAIKHANTPRVQSLLNVRSENWECDTWLKVCSFFL